MTMRVSRETIYSYVYALPRGELRRELTSALRQEREVPPHEVQEERLTCRGPRRLRTGRFLAIGREISFWARTRGQALGTLVERTTRYAILVPLPRGKDATSVRKAYAKALARLPKKDLARSLTFDQGKEMGEHARFTVDTGIAVYFAHPSSPWKRGTNENTDGLVRQFFPKGTDFSAVSVAEVRKVQRLLNGRPRKTLGWKTPSKTFNELLR